MIDSSNINDLNKAKVVDTDGDKVGTVGQVYVDEVDGHPLFATIHTGLFGTSESFVPLENATFDGDTLHVGYSKAKIKDAPNIADDGAIDDTEQDRIFDYYDGTSNTRTSGSAEYETTYAGTDTGTYAGTDAGSLSGADTETSTRTPASTGTDDGSVIRSEERLNVGVQQGETGRVRLRKHVITEQQTVTVPVSHDEVHLERDPITDTTTIGDSTAFQDETHEVVLTEERPVVQKETVAVERVRLDKDTITENQQVTEDIRKEQIDLDDDTTSTTR